ncbi:unnamed protein product [Rangifer tarandus platyrhynchus]|uniref:Uncharacterized protein n=2 Tax=Rangifer tarandus platyrhynchus TaxID=3082113 RepID=A0ACB0ERE6_RANTA|nr:unnamed protein product [Rangifer tarandus platyrhynchus]CAI9702927.1 unnamed protein product [Rangifer tarandus platyrhynchus]
MVMFEQVRANAGKSLKGMDRYDPENLATPDHYEETQAKENIYDLEANPAVLKLYTQPSSRPRSLPRSCYRPAPTCPTPTSRCAMQQEERPSRQILSLRDLLGTCHFEAS